MRQRVLFPGMVVVALMLGAVTAVASSQLFSDVPSSHPFHHEIEAIKGAGITSGSTECNPAVTPAYCPDSLVRRDAMAAFMHRGFGRSADTVRSGPLFVPDLDLVETRVVSGAKGASARQHVVVIGEIQVDTSLGAAGGLDGCPCEVHYDVVIDDGTTDFGLHSGSQVVGPAVGGVIRDTISFSTAFTLPSGETEYTVRVETRVSSSDGAVPAEGVSLAQAQLTALTAPFGWDGGTRIDPVSGPWEFDARAICGGVLVTGWAGAGLDGYYFLWRSTDDPAFEGVYDMYVYEPGAYTLAYADVTIAATLPFGSYNFDVAVDDGDGTVKDDLQDLDGSYSKPEGCP